MKKSNFKFLIFWTIAICYSNILLSQNKISVNGNVTDINSNEPLIGVSVVVKSKLIGTTTDINGRFKIEFDSETSEAILQISMIGYVTQEIPVTSSSRQVDIGMKLNLIMAQEVVVTASRVPEKILEAPVTVIKMNAQDIKVTPKENFYAGLASYKGIDLITGGLIYQIINTRGFNDIANSRVVQLVDGVDNSAPGLGRPFSNLLGAPDVDIEKVEVIPGAASALYGANAFNGLINMITKDPFTYPGLTVQLKGGVNHVDDNYQPAAVYNDFQMRYAAVIKNRFAFKLTGSYTKGSDWRVSDSSDYAAYGSYNGINNPGRNANNIFGDEVAGPLPLGPNGVPVTISRSGYYRHDLIDDNTYSFKTSATAGIKFSEKLQLNYLLQYGQGAVSYDAYALKNVWQISNMLELKGKNFFARTYHTHDEGGDAYNALLSVIRFNNTWKSDYQWFNDYYAAYNGFIPGITASNYDSARAFANLGMPAPGSEAFNHVWDSIISLPIGDGGGKFMDQSSRWHTEAQYDFSNVIKVADIITGGNIRTTYFNSNGTVLIDEPGSPIVVNEYAAYLQATKEILDDKVKLVASVRYDASDNFKGEFTPRFAAVYKPDNKNFIRASYQSGFRMPDPLYQYQNIDLGYARLIGFLPAVDNIFHVKDLTFTSQSVTEYGNAVGAYMAVPGHTIDSAVQLYKNLLVKEPWDYIRPEHIKTFEIGYQHLMFNNSVHFDINYFHNNYSDMHVQETVIKTKDGGPQSDDDITAAAYSILAHTPANPTVSLYTIGVNSFNKATSDGIEAGLSVVLPKEYLISGNFTWIESNVSSDKDLPGFRTPKYKCNIGLSNNNVLKTPDLELTGAGLMQ